MPTLQVRKAPTYTLSIQLYARIGGAVVGSVIALPEVSPGVYEGTVPAGDYDGQLLGFTDPPGPRFPIRDGIGYEGIPWTIIDSTIVVPPVVPTPITGLCNVLVAATFNGSAVVGGPVHCYLEGKNNTVNGYLVSRAIESGVTDPSGNCVLTLIQFGQFITGGIYRLKVSDADGKPLHDRRVKIPNTPTANAEDLEDA